MRQSAVCDRAKLTASPGVAFLAFLIAALSNRLGFLVAVFFSILAWLLVLVLLILDFVIFTVVKNHVAKQISATAAYSAGIWCVCAAFVCLFLGAIFTCKFAAPFRESSLMYWNNRL